MVKKGEKFSKHFVTNAVTSIRTHSVFEYNTSPTVNLTFFFFLCLPLRNSVTPCTPASNRSFAEPTKELVKLPLLLCRLLWRLLCRLLCRLAWSESDECCECMLLPCLLKSKKKVYVSTKKVKGNERKDVLQFRRRCVGIVHVIVFGFA